MADTLRPIRPPARNVNAQRRAIEESDLPLITDTERQPARPPAPPQYSRDLPPISIADADALPPEEQVFPEPAPARGLEAEAQRLPAQPAQPAAPPVEPAESTNGLPPVESRTLTQIHEKLCKPFPLWAVEVKPGATTKDKTRAMAMAYVDARAYQTRLDRLAGPEGWSVEYRPIGERAILCRLTILGVTREDVGECDQGDPNQATSAAMQAFKRACAAFGMGRYLYSLPKPWVEYDDQRRQIKDPTEAARQIYAAAGIDARTK